MEKPLGIKDVKALTYIEYLEKQIEDFKTHTKKKFYNGIQRQLDLLADEMMDKDFKVSLKTSYELQGDKYIKVDTGFDSFFDMMTKGDAIVKAMEKFEEQAFPNNSGDNKKKVVKLEGVEEFLKSQK